MAVKRDVDVPATVQVQFVRAGEIAEAWRGTDSQLFVEVSDANLRASWIDLNKAPRAMVSSDPAGDAMRGPILIARPAGPGKVALSGPPSGVVARDWLWLESDP